MASPDNFCGPRVLSLFSLLSDTRKRRVWDRIKQRKVGDFDHALILDVFRVALLYLDFTRFLPLAPQQPIRVAGQHSLRLCDPTERLDCRFLVTLL